MHRNATQFTLLLVSLLALIPNGRAAENSASETGVKKINDLIIYKDDKFYSAFPSIVRRSSGELICAFRRAPNRRIMGVPGYSHTDPNSQLMLVRSKDNGATWSEPELFHANPFGGSQDPCMIQLRDGTLVCASYGWCLMSAATGKEKNLFHHSNYSFLGGYIVRSKDGGHSWEPPIIPPPTPGEKTLDIFGKPVPAYNRGAMCEGKDGRLYWVVALSDFTKKRLSSTHLMISADKGKTWNYSCPVAKDDNITFNETSIYETPKGDLVAFLRTDNFDDHTAIARSTDHGKSFQKWEDAGFQGHPHYALQLPDKRVLLIYGYRHVPFGVRARVLNAECTNFASAPETILRDDGGNGDLGYPWATMISKNRALVVYYFHPGDEMRYIAGTVLEIK